MDNMMKQSSYNNNNDSKLNITASKEQTLVGSNKELSHRHHIYRGGKSHLPK